MSVGDTVYTSDDRVLVSHREDSTDWVLQFKFVRERDEGIYECQVRKSFVLKKNHSRNYPVMSVAHNLYPHHYVVAHVVKHRPCLLVF